jgi:hypothetical protein
MISSQLPIAKLSRLDIGEWTIWDWILLAVILAGGIFLITKISVFVILLFLFTVIVLLFSDEKLYLWNKSNF